MIRASLLEVPIRLRDLPQDLRDALLRRSYALPPARLRRRVGLTSARAEFEQVGRSAAADIIGVYREVAEASEPSGRWLDFGCGSGRIAGFLRRCGVAHLYGVDIDAEAIRWLQARDAEAFSVAPRIPPLAFPGASFDVAVAMSVFSHMCESAQLEWLGELSRVLRPGGLLIASTHGKDLLVTRGDLSARDLALLADRGFLFAPGGGPFNDDSAFHELPYLTRIWGPWFKLRCFKARGLMGYQDLSVWENLGSRQKTDAYHKYQQQ